jgi:molecular chaperone HtpG/TNF receptor-associated protein 1
MEPLKENAGIPVLILTNSIDEMIFSQQGSYKQKKFVNVETSFEDIMKDLGINDSSNSSSRLPEEDVTPFCLWLKNELSQSVS